MLEPLEGTLEIRVAVTIAGDEVEIDFDGHVAAARRKSELSARRHPLGLLLRRPVSDCARHPGVWRRLRTGDRTCARGLTGERRSLRRRWSQGTRRRRVRITDIAVQRLRAGGHRPGAGPGDDEQRHARKPATSRTTRRSEAGRAPVLTAATARRRSTWRCRTRSTLRSRRSSSRTRSEFAATRFVPGPAGPGSFPRGRRRDPRARGARACTGIAPDRTAPYGPAGARGGAAGEPGRNLLNGVELPSKVTRWLEPGDVLRIETPGGGGFGPGGRAR